MHTTLFFVALKTQSHPKHNKTHPKYQRYNGRIAVEDNIQKRMKTI